MQHWNPSLLLVFPVDSISPQLRRTSDQVGLIQVKVKVRAFAGALTALNQHVPFGPVKGHSGRPMPEMVTSRPCYCYAWGQLLGAKSTSLVALGQGQRPW
jgi:hypothetical protein